MQMIDVLKRLAELDQNNPNVVYEKPVQTKEAPVMEGKEVEINLPEPGVNDLKVLSGVKPLNESFIPECGMPAMGAPVPTMPATFNMSAQSATEIINMMRGMIDLAKSDVPAQTMMPALGAPMPGSMANAMGDVDNDGDHDMQDHELEQPDAGVLEPAEPEVSGPTFGDDDTGGDELADMMKKLKTGEPVKITTDMPVKVSSDEPMKAITDKLNKIDSDDEAEKEGILGALAGGAVGAAAGGPLGALTGAAAGDQLTDDDPKEQYANEPDEKVRDYNPNDFANIVNKVRSADLETTPYGSGSNPMPDGKKKEESVAFEGADDLTSKLFAEYKRFVSESK